MSLPSFPKEANRYVEHCHNYYGLNQKPHFAALPNAARLSHRSCTAANRQPLLARMSSLAIASRIGVSRWYAGKIRQGYRPHPRHWQALAALVDVGGRLTAGSECNRDVTPIDCRYRMMACCVPDVKGQ